MAIYTVIEECVVERIYEVEADSEREARLIANADGLIVEENEFQHKITGVQLEDQE